MTELGGFHGRVARVDLTEGSVEYESVDQGDAEGSLVELEEMKDEYYEVRGWVDGVVPDEKLDELGIDVGTGVSAGDSAAPADD